MTLPHTPSPAADDSTSDSLLSKANSLIHRNRASKVDFELDDAPSILLENVDDLPELTDELDTLEDNIELNEEFDPLPTHIIHPTESPAPVQVAQPATTAPKLPENIAPLFFKTDAELSPALPLNVPPIEMPPPAPPVPYISTAATAAPSTLHAVSSMTIATPAAPVEPGISRDEMDKTIALAVDKAKMDIVEHLIDLDAYLAQSLDAWLNTELPPLISRELEGMVERLRVKAAAHMHATLLPDLSAKLSKVLENSRNKDK